MYFFNATTISYVSLPRLLWAPLLGLGFPDDPRVVDGLAPRFRSISALVVDDFVPALLVFDDATLRSIDLLAENTTTWYGVPGDSQVVDGRAPVARVQREGFGVASNRRGRLYFTSRGAHCVRLWKYAIEIAPLQLDHDVSDQYFLSTVLGNCSEKAHGAAPLSVSASAARFDSIHSLTVFNTPSGTDLVFIADANGIFRWGPGAKVTIIFTPTMFFAVPTLAFNLAAIQTNYNGDVLFTAAPASRSASENSTCRVYRFVTETEQFLIEPVALNLSDVAVPNATCEQLRVMPRPTKNLTYLSIGTRLFRFNDNACGATPLATATPMPTTMPTVAPPSNGPSSNSTLATGSKTTAIAVGASLGAFAAILVVVGIVFRLHCGDGRVVVRRGQSSAALRPPSNRDIGGVGGNLVDSSPASRPAAGVPPSAVSTQAERDATGQRRQSPSPNEPATVSERYHDPMRSPPLPFVVTASDPIAEESHGSITPRAPWEQDVMPQHDPRGFPPPLQAFGSTAWASDASISAAWEQGESDHENRATVTKENLNLMPTPPRESPFMGSTDSGDTPALLASVSSRRPLAPLSEADVASLSAARDVVEGAEFVSPVTPVAKELLCETGHIHRLRLVGRGSSGSVYAVLLGDGSTVAMKEMLLTLPGQGSFETQLAEIQREIAVMSQLTHPRIVRYFFSKADLVEMKVNLFMEFVPGGSLTKMARDLDRPIAESLLRRYVRQTVDGLAFIHSKGIVHRDLKGENLLLSGDGSVKIADFGTARVLCPQSLLAQTMIGTPMFMAPEILMDLTEESHDSNGFVGYGAKADIWSLGITVCELANRGMPPWPSFSSPGQAFTYIANPANMPIIPEYLSATAIEFVRLCCTRDPTRRPSAAELLAHPWIRSKAKSSSDASLESSVASTEKTGCADAMSRDTRSGSVG